MDMYKRACQKLKEIDEATYKDLMNRNLSKWCKAFFPAGSFVDICENNLSEGFNGSLVESRGKPLIYVLEHLRMSMMTRLHKRRESMFSHWDVICPRIRRRIEANTVEYRLSNTTYNRNNKFQVDYLKWGYIVDIENKKCTCTEWDLSGIPCCHAIADWYILGRR